MIVFLKPSQSVPSHLFAWLPLFFLLHHSDFLCLLLFCALVLAVVPVLAAVAGRGVAVIPVFLRDKKRDIVSASETKAAASVVIQRKDTHSSAISSSSSPGLKDSSKI